MIGRLTEKRGRPKGRWLDRVGMISERRDCRGRKRGRPKGRWLDRVGNDIKEKGLSGEEERKA